jgi:hypothetical protein
VYCTLSLGYLTCILLVVSPGYDPTEVSDPEVSDLEMSVVNQAVGILIDRGHVPEAGLVELIRRARRGHVSIYVAAQELIQEVGNA